MNKPAKRSAIDQVAELAGVSIKTVSRVFNNEPNVREKTRAKVLAAAEQLKYRPNLSARRLAAKRSFVLGLLYDNHADYTTAIQEGCLEVCRKAGYHLLIQPCGPDQPDFIEYALDLYHQSTVDGFILTPPLSEMQPLVAAFEDKGVKVVRVAQRHTSHTPFVSVDDEGAASDVVQHLLDLGHDRIGIIVGHPEHGSAHDRLRGYRNTLTRAGVPVDESLILQGYYSFESGFSCARRMIGMDNPPTAIFASNDHMAMGVLAAAYDQKIAVPDQLSVCGFDDIPLARYAWPPLTTVRQPIKQMAAAATEMLIDIIGGKEREGIILHSELVPRTSSSKPRVGLSLTSA